MFNSNEPIKVAHLQKLANQSLLNGALVMEIVINSLWKLMEIVINCQESKCVGSPFNKVAGLKVCIFPKKNFQHSCFPVNIAKF